MNDSELSSKGRTRRIFILCLCLISPAVAYYAGNVMEQSRTYALNVEMASSVSDSAQVFFDVGNGYTEQDSTTVATLATDAPRLYRFLLPRNRFYSLRFDLLNHAGRVRISSAAIVDSQGTVLHKFRPDDLIPRASLRISSKSNSEVTFETTNLPGEAFDPIVIIRDSSFTPLSTRFLVRFCWFIVLALFCFGISFLLWVAATRQIRSLRGNNGYLRSQKYFRIAVIFFTLMTFVYAMCFPLIVSYDGMEYAYLANVLFSPDFGSHWNFFRTPLFPLTLRAAFFLGGEQPESALLVTSLLGWGGVLMLGSAVRHLVGGASASILILLLTFYPVLIGYEHLLLSETGTFFFVAMLVWLSVRVTVSPNAKGWSHVLLIAATLSAGYYWRPTIIYLSPVLAVIYALMRVSTTHLGIAYSRLFQMFRGKGFQILAEAAVMAVLPWLATYPWIRTMIEHNVRPSETILLLGLYKQVVVPPDDPVLHEYAQQYRRVIDRNSQNGRLAFDGISFGDRDGADLSTKITEALGKTGSTKLISRYPFRYLRAVMRSVIFFMGVPGFRTLDDENAHFSAAVFGLWPQNYALAGSVGWDSSYKQFIPEPYSGGGALGRWLAFCLTPYMWIIRIASLASLALFFMSWKCDLPAGIAFSAVPLAFFALHALTAFSEIRYAFPVYPLCIANLVVVAALLARRFLVRPN